MEQYRGDAGGNMNIKVSFGPNNFDVSVTPQSTFGDLKRVIAKATGLDPAVLNVLFRGNEKDDHESLQMAGVKDNAKVILIENTPTKNVDHEDTDIVMEDVEEISRGLEAVNRVREENIQLEEQVVSLEAVVCSRTQVADKDFIFLTEMLMRQLLKLDEIDADGEGRIQRKLEVCRVQGLVEKLDNLRVKNSNPTSNVQEKADEPSLPSSSKVEEFTDNVEEVSRGNEAVGRVREENNQFEEQVITLETVVCSGTQVADKDFIYLTEMLMRQLLKLDGIESDGEGRVQRKLEVHRVQGLVEKLDNLRAKNSNPSSNVREKADEPSWPPSSSKM